MVDAPSNAVANNAPTSEVMVTLQSLDDVSFELPLAAARLSEMVSQAVSDDSEDSHETIEPIQCLRVTHRALEKVVDFLKHYREEPFHEVPQPLANASFDEVVTQEWYRDFASENNLSDDLLPQVLGAANYMSISPLLDLICLKYTFRLMGKTKEEIREMLNLPELTPEEEARAREQHSWLFETTNA